MSQKLKNNWIFIQLLTNTTQGQVKALLNSSSTAQIASLIEIVFNFLKGNIPVTPTTLEHLRKYRHFLRKLTDKSISYATKKKAFIKNQKVIVYFLKQVKSYLETQV